MLDIGYEIAGETAQLCMGHGNVDGPKIKTCHGRFYPACLRSNGIGSGAVPPPPIDHGI